MADNIAVTPGTGATIGADEISSVKYQRVKLILGADGVNDGDVASGNPLPVSGTVAVTGVATSAKQDTGNASLASIDGKITAVNTGAVTVAASALPTGAATSAKQDTGNASVASIDAKIPALGQALAAASIPVVLTAAQISTLTPVAGLTDTQLRATAVPVSGTVAVTNAGITSIDGKVTACNTGAVVLAAGTAAIGKLVANSGVDIGDVDVTSLPAIPAGNNNIGDVDIASIAAGDNNIGNVDVVTLPALAAGTNNIGDVDVLTLPNVNLAVDEATLVVKTVDFTASQTAQTIWTPAAGKKFVICDIVLSASAAGAITLFDGTDNTTLRVAKFNLAANGGAVIAYKKPYKSATADNILKYTTGSGIAGSATISGYEV